MIADHAEVIITPVPGSGFPGCEETKEGCYDPLVATVDVGGKVIFSNTDVVVHVFAAGTIKEPTGEFDSGLVNPGASFEWTPTEVGTVEHFCTVHPWMSGTIIVQSSGTNITNPPPPSTPPPEPTNEEIIEQLETKVDRKTEIKNMWKEKFNICKDNRSTIKSELSDLQSEHLTLETKYNEAFFTIEKLKQELYEAQKRIEELESN